ncbi:MAG: hypothetical protein PHI86_04940 [Candidatus Omnitrophica bacterium]|nr:hypothetical protein [Candidatus Omnitrophota bacterium]
MRKSCLLFFVFLSASCFYVFAQGNEAEVDFDSQLTNSYDAVSYRDPFMPEIRKEEKKKGENLPQGVQEAPPEFVVQGMIWSSDNPQAIIDGQVLRLGDDIKEAKIIDISKEGVKFLYRGKIITAKPKINFEKK